MSNQIRVFLSSTFLDFGQERELIHVELKPMLEEMCRHFGLTFELSDLRWGVTARDVDRNRTARICLDEVDVCMAVSPELNFFVLLGDRVGSRFVPDEVAETALAALLSELDRRSPHDMDSLNLAARLRAIYPARLNTHAGVVTRDVSPTARTIADAVITDPATPRSLSRFECADVSAEELRTALAFSLTHQEILRSRIFTHDGGNPGAVAILRTRGDPDEVQQRMRSAVAHTLGVAAQELPAADERDASYDQRFITAASALLGDRVLAARHRGSRTHHFLSLVTDVTGPRVDAQQARDRTVSYLAAWLSRNDSRPAAGIIGETGSGRTAVLADVSRMMREGAPATRIIELDVGSQPSLQTLRQLAMTITVALADPPLTEGEIDALSSSYSPEVIARARRELAHAEQAGPLAVLVDDLDLVVDVGDHSAFSWLWSGSRSRKVVFTCGPRLGAELGLDVDAINLERLANSDLLAVAHAACSKRAQWLDARSVAKAARARALPGYLHTLIDAAVLTDGDDWERWAFRGPDVFYARFFGHLLETSPFSRSVSTLFLGFCAATDHGIAAREFLSICYADEVRRRELADQFRAPPFVDQVPWLVWHRLVNHFANAIESVGGSGNTSYRVRAGFRSAVEGQMGPTILQDLQVVLAEHLLASIDSVDKRGVVVMPALMGSTGRNALLARLALTRPFMKLSVVHERAESLARAVAGSSARDEIVNDIVHGALSTTIVSPEAHSHWLLDLTILTRELGYYAEAADLAARAVDIRRTHLGGLHPLTVAAVLEATDSDLEAGNYEHAEELCATTLQEIDTSFRQSPPLLRVLGNQASALVYQNRDDEAESLLRQLQALYEADGGDSDQLFSVYNTLALIASRRGDFRLARKLSDSSARFAADYWGPTSETAAIALANLGGQLLEDGASDDAIPLFERALAIFAVGRDATHPKTMNAAAGYVAALAASSRAGEAVDVVVEQLGGDVHFEDAAVWIHVALPAFLQIIDEDDAPRFLELLSLVEHLADASAQQGTNRFATRAVRHIARSMSFVDDETSVKGFFTASISLWILAVMAASRRELLSRREADSHLETLEALLSTIFGEATTCAGLHEKIHLSWATFAPNYSARQACEQLLIELRPPSRSTGLIDEFRQAGAPSIEELTQQIDAAATAGPQSDQRGVALVAFAARAAADGRYDDAIAAQAEAAEIAADVYGMASGQYAIALTNLGSLHFRALHYAQAFQNYRDGVLFGLRVDISLGALGGSIENMATAGFRADKPRETGEALRDLADLLHPSAAALNFRLMAADALCRGGATRDALDALEQAMRLDDVAGSQDEEAWLESLATATALVNQQLAGEDRQRLRSMLVTFESVVARKGWQIAYLDTDDWSALYETSED